LQIRPLEIILEHAWVEECAMRYPWRMYMGEAWRAYPAGERIRRWTSAAQSY
jgi:hypothetical protein